MYVFKLYDDSFKKQRLPLLEKGALPTFNSEGRNNDAEISEESEEYSDRVKEFIATSKWAILEFKNKAFEMLQIEAQFGEQLCKKYFSLN